MPAARRVERRQPIVRRVIGTSGGGRRPELIQRRMVSLLTRHSRCRSGRQMTRSGSKELLDTVAPFSELLACLVNGLADCIHVSLLSNNLSTVVFGVYFALKRINAHGPNGARSFCALAHSSV